ncbi:hypothetical protein BS78_08G143500 [Paspalum vaginatum]|nr:hypothetical protein BS78_08G143500 [Paspalum vaginatum]
MHKGQEHSWRTNGDTILGSSIWLLMPSPSKPVTILCVAHGVMV